LYEKKILIRKKLQKLSDLISQGMVVLPDPRSMGLAGQPDPAPF